MYGGTWINIGCVPTTALVHESAPRRGTDEPRSRYSEAVAKVESLVTMLRGNTFEMLDSNTPSDSLL
jgi:pyruvate/2-oxoglutarate dehydrogenase complex dihydrolipoamide dehydrogenase (E3) component